MLLRASPFPFILPLSISSLSFSSMWDSSISHFNYAVVWRQNFPFYPPYIFPIKAHYSNFYSLNSVSTFPLPKTLKTKAKKANQMKKKIEKIPNQEQEEEEQYWLLKTEVGEWSWEDQVANNGKSKWDGVKNKQAQKYLKSMKLGDLCFFYHSGAKARRIVGVVSVVKECYDDGDEGGVAVDVAEVGEMRRVVDLAEMKVDERLKGSGFALFRQPRLSVVPVSKEVWERVCELGGGYVGDGGGEGG